jgi:hypothetical protein
MLLEEREKEWEDKEEDVSSYCMTLRKREGSVTIRYWNVQEEAL